jgi:fucose permease
MKLKSATVVVIAAITACTIAMIFPTIECVYNLCNGIENTLIHWFCLSYFAISLSITVLLLRFSTKEDPEKKL